MLVTNDTWIQAQQAVLGSCLIDERAAVKIVFGLSESDFCVQYRTLYLAIRDLYMRCKPVDPVAIMAEVGNEYLQTIKDLMAMTPTAANIDYYVEIVRTQSRVLQLRDTGRKLLAVNDELEAEQIMAEAVRPDIQQDADTWSLSDGLRNWMTRYQSSPEYFEWFIPQLRRIIRAEKNDYFILGARPSAGKSAFAIQAALYWSVVCRKRVGFFSHETSREKLMDRLISCATNVPLEAIKERKLSEKQMAAVCDVSSRISEAPLDLVKAAGKTVLQMRERALHKHYDILIVDYLQIVAAHGNTEYEQVTSISKELHTMCQTYGIFCLALCQLNRTKGARPTLEDLRSSGQIEQDADFVCFLHVLPDSKNRSREFIVSKNKDGELATTKLAFQGEVQQFQYLGKGDKPLKAYDYGAARFISPEPCDGSQTSFAEITGSDPKLPFEE